MSTNTYRTYAVELLDYVVAAGFLVCCFVTLVNAGAVLHVTGIVHLDIMATAFAETPPPSVEYMLGNVAAGGLGGAFVAWMEVRND
jgi:hypothetical protein